MSLLTDSEETCYATVTWTLPFVSFTALNCF